MLTNKQYELLTFIDEILETRGIAPSFEEMKKAINLKSKSGIHRLIIALEERGYLRRLPNRARALEILKLPNNKDTNRINFNSSNVVKGNFSSNQNEGKSNTDNHETTIPLYGKIAAGMPIEALNDPSVYLSIPANMVGNGEYFALTIEGESMIEEGILDGDNVIIRQTNHAENGSIIVALIDDKEATLKRIRKKGDTIALEPANASHETQIYGPDRVKVQGKLVGLIRSYN
ncbi:MAG: transcriptional repressor LexA [Pseudomonadota bacterium]|nr:transcriptional repressor LexA [Pseudomonadota bacterium]